MLAVARNLFALVYPTRLIQRISSPNPYVDIPRKYPEIKPFIDEFLAILNLERKRPFINTKILLVEQSIPDVPEKDIIKVRSFLIEFALNKSIDFRDRLLVMYFLKDMKDKQALMEIAKAEGQDSTIREAASLFLARISASPATIQFLKELIEMPDTINGYDSRGVYVRTGDFIQIVIDEIESKLKEEQNRHMGNIIQSLLDETKHKTG